MKQAKKRLLPTLAKLVGSANRARRSIANTLALVATSNRRIARMEWNAATAAAGSKAVSREKAEAVNDLYQFMHNDPKVGAVDVKALIREGRD